MLLPVVSKNCQKLLNLSQDEQNSIRAFLRHPVQLQANGPGGCKEIDPPRTPFQLLKCGIPGIVEDSFQTNGD